MDQLFLIGGGRDHDGFVASHRSFADAVQSSSGGEVCVAILDHDGRENVQPLLDRLTGLGLHPVPMIVGPDAPPENVEVSSLYVAGGDTPAYQEVLCRDTLWLGGVSVYGGFSAGAVIAASQALVGGWLADGIPICDAEVSEGLVELELRPGLGLTASTIDVHCAQWGTLPRLIHGVREAQGARGWGIDEYAALELRDGLPHAVHGTGAVWSVEVESTDAFVKVRTHPAGRL